MTKFLFFFMISTVGVVAQSQKLKEAEKIIGAPLMVYDSTVKRMWPEPCVGSGLCKRKIDINFGLLSGGHYVSARLVYNSGTIFSKNEEGLRSNKEVIANVGELDHVLIYNILFEHITNVEAIIKDHRPFGCMGKSKKESVFLEKEIGGKTITDELIVKHLRVKKKQLIWKRDHTEILLTLSEEGYSKIISYINGLLKEVYPDDEMSCGD